VLGASSMIQMCPTQRKRIPIIHTYKSNRLSRNYISRHLKRRRHSTKKNPGFNSKTGKEKKRKKTRLFMRTATLKKKKSNLTADVSTLTLKRE
jgi:hypothetical protein